MAAKKKAAKAKQKPKAKAASKAKPQAKKKAAAKKPATKAAPKRKAAPKIHPAIKDITFFPAVTIATPNEPDPEKPEISSDDYSKPGTFMPPVAYGLTGSVAALIESIGAKKGASRTPIRAKRTTLLSGIQSAKAGEVPPPLSITSKANGSYAAHATKLYELAKTGDIDAIKAAALPMGMNTYAKALRGYRTALETFLTTAGA
ncbi:hypothetical protein UFOVP1040_24 [uncultured Caudovirales phage]|uniref:Uncharacterized protein n=1 Tax=uncultured Caudovirales phage TaxID=2100421 RepID=A0A6J5Q6U6_9CAUD|nr:hypothetical protein UFOVP1040_24 [uncultured Caudovirales phage]